MDRKEGSSPSSAVTTPFTRIGSEVMLCSHLTSCTFTNPFQSQDKSYCSYVHWHLGDGNWQYLPAEGAVNLPSNVRRQPRIVGLKIPDKSVSSVGK
jgi:hypothetical protein